MRDAAYLMSMIAAALQAKQPARAMTLMNPDGAIRNLRPKIRRRIANRPTTKLLNSHARKPGHTYTLTLEDRFMDSEVKK